MVTGSKRVSKLDHRDRNVSGFPRSANCFDLEVPRNRGLPNHVQSNHVEAGAVGMVQSLLYLGADVHGSALTTKLKICELRMTGIARYPMRYKERHKSSWATKSLGVVKWQISTVNSRSLRELSELILQVSSKTKCQMPLHPEALCPAQTGTTKRSRGWRPAA